MRAGFMKPRSVDVRPANWPGSEPVGAVRYTGNNKIEYKEKFMCCVGLKAVRNTIDHAGATPA